MSYDEYLLSGVVFFGLFLNYGLQSCFEMPCTLEKLFISLTLSLFNKAEEVFLHGQAFLRHVFYVYSFDVREKMNHPGFLGSFKG